MPDDARGRVKAGKQGEGRPETGRPSAHGGPRHPWSPLDDALRAFREGDAAAVVAMRTDVGGAEDVPVSLFFRAPDAMGPVEAGALGLSRGRVLEVGAGPGAHAAPLSRAGLAVTALEILPEAVRALRDAGVPDVREGGMETVGPDERFDTVLVLMNGLGLAGTLSGLRRFLAQLATCLAPGGQILADSTDARAWDMDGDGRYPGEIHMQLGFAGAWGEPFPFLFVDADTLRAEAEPLGLAVEVVAEEPEGRYLARITVGTRAGR